MAQRFWFGDDYWDFDDDATEEDINRVGTDWQRFGNLNAVRQKHYLEGLARDPQFLAMPRIDRHKKFSEIAQNGPYWQLIDPVERRNLRGIAVDAEGANEREAYNGWDAPFKRGDIDIWDKIEGGGAMGFFPGGKTETAQKFYSTLAEGGRGLKRNLAPVIARAGAGIPNILESIANHLESNPVEPPAPSRDMYTNPLFQSDPAKKAFEARGVLADEARERMIAAKSKLSSPLVPEVDQTTAQRGIRDLAEVTRRNLMDASVGAEMITAPRKYQGFGEGWEEAGLGGAVQAGAAMIGEQAPVMGAIAGAASIPGVGTVLGPAMAMSMQTGAILEDLEREGITGDDARAVASTLGVVTGAMEYLPINRLLGKNPIIAKSWKSLLTRKALQSLQQGASESITEGLQSAVEEAAGDFVRMNRGELDTIEAWTTPEGRKETLGSVWSSMVEGGFIGALMGPFGGGTGKVRPDGEVDPVQSGEDFQANVEYALGELRRAAPTGDQGPAVPEFERMEPTYPDQGPPADAEPGIVAPTGSPAPSPGEALLPGLGPEGATTLERGEWSEEDERNARANYAPGWIRANAALFDAYVRGDIDQDTHHAMMELAEEQGRDRELADQDLIKAGDQAVSFLTGGMIQPEAGPLAVLETEGEAGFPDAPTIPHGVESGSMRLGEGVVEEPAPEGPPQTPQAPPAAPAAPVTPAAPAGQEAAERRSEPRYTGREVDQAKNELFNLQRERGYQPEVINAVISAIERGQEPHVVFGQEEVREAGLDQDTYQAAVNLSDAIESRIAQETVEAEQETEIAEMLGEQAAVVEEGPVPEGTPGEIEAMTQGESREARIAGLEKVLAGEELSPAARKAAEEILADLKPAEPKTVPKQKTAEQVEASPEVGDRFSREDGASLEVVSTRVKEDGTLLVRIKYDNGREHTFQHKHLKSVKYNALATGEKPFGRRYKDAGQSLHDWVRERGGIKGYTRGELNEELFGTSGRGGIPLSIRNDETGAFADEALKDAIADNVVPRGTTIDEFIEILQGPDVSAEEAVLQEMETVEQDEGPTDEEYREKYRKEKGEEPPFDVSKPSKAKPARGAEVRKAFPGWAVRQVKQGLFRLTREGQPIVHVLVKRQPAAQGEIEKAAKAHGLTTTELVAGIRAGELAVKGAYTFNEIKGTHLVTLYDPAAGPDTVFEEALHFVIHNVLRPTQRKQLFKVYENEEAIASAYKKRAARGAIQKIFDTIRDFAQRLLGANNVDLDAAKSLMDKVISGKIYEQPGDQLKAFSSPILNAEEAAKEALAARKLKPSEFPEAVRSAEKEMGHSFVDRGDHTMFDVSSPADVQEGHHPAAFLPDRTLSEKKMEEAESFIINKLAPIRQIQEKLTNIGAELDNAFNAYQKAQNFQSRAGALLDWSKENLFRPFLVELDKSGIKREDFGRAWMAVHALERNVKVEAARVGTPIRLAEKQIKNLSKKKLTPGVKVRALDNNVTGTVVSVNNETGVAEVVFTSARGFKTKPKRIPMSKLERESVAKAKDDIAEVRRIQQAGEMPNSGISNEDAKAILEEMRLLGMVSWQGQLGPNTTYTGKMGDLLREIGKVSNWKLNTLYKSGLLSKAEFDRLRKYKYYAPMRGKEPDIIDLINGGSRMSIPAIEKYGGTVWHRALGKLARGTGIEKPIHTAATGRGLNPGRMPAAHRALGRRSYPQHDPMVVLFSDTMEAAVRAEKNRVAQGVWNMLHLIRDAKDQHGNKLFEIDRPDARLAWDEKTGTVKTQIDGLSVSKDNVYSVWINGDLHYIRHVAPEMAEFVSALNNIAGDSSINAFFKAGGAINRYISKMATSLNPAFAFPNFIRDVVTAGIRLAGDKQFEELGMKTMKKIPSSWNTLREYGRRQSKGTLNEMDPAKRKRVEDWKLAGGETAFWMIPDLELNMRQFDKEMAEIAKTDPLGLRGFKAIISFIEDYNAAVEGATRFSVYERALEVGASRDKAGRLSRNISVDFTQQGNVARHLGGLYVFANASIQGSTMVIKSTKDNKKIQKMLLASMAMAASWAPFMRLVGGEDEEDGIAYYDKVSWHEKSRNIILMVPGGKGHRLRIPLPWGFNVPWAAATAISDYVFGPKTASEATFNILSTALSAFNPIGDNDPTTLKGLTQMAMPAWVDPITDIAMNKAWHGGPIRPEPGKYARSEQYGVEAPKYNRYFSGASEGSKKLTKALYKHFGLDWSPEDVDYGVGAVFGGLGDLVNRSIGTIYTGVTQKRGLVARDFPIVKSFYGDEPNYFTPEMYRANMGDYWKKKETYDYLYKRDKKAAYDFKKRHYEVLRMEDYVKQTEKRVRDLKKKDVMINDSRMQKLFKQFNRRYNTVELQTMKRRVQER